jgi:hypothetical protein
MAPGSRPSPIRVVRASRCGPSPIQRKTCESKLQYSENRQHQRHFRAWNHTDRGLLKTSFLQSPPRNSRSSNCADPSPASQGCRRSFCGLSARYGFDYPSVSNNTSIHECPSGSTSSGDALLSSNKCLNSAILRACASCQDLRLSSQVKLAFKPRRGSVMSSSNLNPGLVKSQTRWGLIVGYRTGKKPPKIFSSAMNCTANGIPK